MKVAVAVIFDGSQRVLITRRPDHVPHAGMWEFPGGKLESGEEAPQALKREILEEVGLRILSSEYLGEVVFQYPDKNVTLLVFFVLQFTGEARCCESQTDLRWVERSELANYQFPEANHAVLRMISDLAIL